MRRIIYYVYIFLLFMLIGEFLWAQRGSGVGGGPSFKYANGLSTKPNIFTGTSDPQFADQMMLFTGGEGYIANKGVIFGGAGWSGNFQQVTSGNKLTYRLTYGGFIFGHEFLSSTLFGLSVGNMIGTGSYELVKYNNITSTTTSGTFFHVKGELFLFEPFISMRLNLTAFFGLGLNVSYLYATHTDVIQEGEGPNNTLLTSSELAELAPTHLAFRLIILVGDY